MKNTLAILAAAGLLALQPAQAQFVNGDFSGGLTGWLTEGDVAVQGASAVLTTASVDFEDDGTPAGAFNISGTSASLFNDVETFAGVAAGAFDDTVNGIFAQEGSAIQQAFTVLGGTDDVIQFNWQLFTNEGANPDYAFVVITDTTLNSVTFFGTLALASDASAPSTPYASETGVGTFFSSTLAAGNYNLTVGILDMNDFGATSSLAIDNVTAIPEPSALMLGLVSTAGFVFLRRRRARA